MSSRKFLLSSLSLAAATLFAAPAFADEASDALARKLDALQAQMQAMQQQIDELKRQNEALAAQQEGAPAPVAAAGEPAAANAAAADGTARDNAFRHVPSSPVTANVGLNRVGFVGDSNLSVFGYGEITYSNYDHDSSRDEADLARAVFGFGYRYSSTTRFASEFELEHAIASADDAGEMEVEQFYIEHDLATHAGFRAGLFLIPAGFVNQVHEPNTYYGVFRNQVETAIIPSTWREGGLNVFGSTDFGLYAEAGVTSGFNLANWDYSGESEGRESTLGSIHQELQFAKVADLSQYVSLDYQGLPGVRVGGSVFTGEIDQNQPGVTGNPRLTLWEGHARYQLAGLDLSALYAHGNISDTAALNLANVGQPTPIPKAFYGWYTQAAYRAWADGAQSLAPFVRYERYNTASDFASQPVGLGTDPAQLQTVVTYGLNFYLDPRVVFKADYQSFLKSSDDRFDLGVGLQF